MSALAYLPMVLIGILLPIACIRAAWCERRRKSDALAALACCWPMYAIAALVAP